MFRIQAVFLLFCFLIEFFMIYIYIKYSGEGIYGYRLHNAKLFERIEHCGIR